MNLEFYSVLKFFVFIIIFCLGVLVIDLDECDRFIRKCNRGKFKCIENDELVDKLVFGNFYFGNNNYYNGYYSKGSCVFICILYYIVIIVFFVFFK